LHFKLLVSACLLGQPVRYDGKSKPIKEIDWLMALKATDSLVIMCPEVMGGLTTPRPPAEVVNGQVITINGDNVTTEFNLGANTALELCQAHNVTHALLKANSPSCGNEMIYNGQFNGTLIAGQGVTAQLLTAHNITVFSELQLDELQTLIRSTFSGKT
jgi:uncharacterized protein YbbK (DUF523 family)